MATETLTAPVDTGSLSVSHAPQQASQSEKFARTANEDVGFLSPPKLEFSTPYEEREYIKGKLACAYRVSEKSESQYWESRCPSDDLSVLRVVSRLYLI